MDDLVEINVEVVAMKDTFIPLRETTLQVDYYPIECVESNRSIFGTISYNFQGKQNQPNLTYVNPGDTTQFGRNYVAKELFVLPYRECFREFPFLANCSIPDTVDGALIISNYAITNSVEPIYTIFFLVNNNVNAQFTDEKIREKSNFQILPLFDRKAIGADNMKQWTQSEPHILTLNDFLKPVELPSKIFTVDKYHQIDHRGNHCVIAVSDIMIPIFVLPSAKELVPQSTPTISTESIPTNAHNTNVGNEILREGFDVGEDVNNLFTGMFSGVASDPNANHAADRFGKDTTVATIQIPLQDDPNYSYQECTMVPIDDINQESEYVYQVGKSSPMISNKTVTLQGNLLTYLIAYFIMFLLTYFGTPFVYSFLMCTILKRGYNYTGYTALIDYLKRPQNFFGIGKFNGLTIVFNIFYWLTTISTFIFGSVTIAVWNVIMWIVGYIGIVNNPLPESCLFS